MNCNYIWITFGVFCTIVLVSLFKKKFSAFIKIITPFRQWARYKLVFSTCCSILLIFCILVAFVMGAWLELVKTMHDMVSTGGIWTDLRCFLEAVEEASISGVHTVFGILDGEAESLRNGYPNWRLLTWALCFGIPVLTVSTVLSVLVDFFPRPLYKKEEYLIFSQAEENSIRLAESMMLIQEDGKSTVRKDRMVVFLRTEKESLSPERVTRLRRINAREFQYTEADFLRIHWKLQMRNIRFFFLSSDTDLNFSRMKTLLTEVEKDTLFSKPRSAEEEKLTADEEKGVFRQELYLLSETGSAPMLIDRLRKELCKDHMNDKGQYERKSVFAHTDLRLLDRYRTVMYDLLQKKPLHEKADNKRIRVLILGFGRVGQAFFRSAVTFCAMAGYDISFCIRDMNIDKKWDELILEYPRCSEGISVEKACLNVLSEGLLKLIDRNACLHTPFTYIVLSLGDDERNIKVASRLARHYRQRYWENSSIIFPTICVNLEEEIKSDYVSLFFKEAKPDVPLHVFGSDDKTFSESLLINRGLWLAARMLHRELKDDNFAYWSEYERRSSVASVAHAPYHVKAMQSRSSKEYDEDYDKLKGTLKEDMIDAEHRRWMYYSSCEGMNIIEREVARKIQEATGSHVDTVARLTPCLLRTKELHHLYQYLYPSAPKENRMRMKRGERPFRTFYERDRFVVSNAGRLTDIIETNSFGEGLREFEKDR